MNIYAIYGLFGSIRLINDVLFSRFIFGTKIRIIRRPFYIRGKKYIFFGKNLTSGVGLRIDAFNIYNRKILVRFGNNIQLNDYVHIGSVHGISIGSNTLIGSKVLIIDHNHGDYSQPHSDSIPSNPPSMRKLVGSRIKIGKNVWIGENSCILPGVSIGNGSIVAAGSIVNKNVPINTIVAGNPAKIIKSFNEYSHSWNKV